jgi:hypothetical protein
LNSPVVQALVTEERVELFVAREAEEVRPDGHVFGRRRPGLREGFEQHAEKACAVRCVPDGQREPAAWNEDAHELRRRLFGASQVEDGEVADDGVEGRVFEGKGVRIRLSEVDIRMEPSREGDHRFGYVRPNDLRSTSCRFPGDVAGTGGDIEHARSGRHRRCIEQRLHHPARERAEEPVVVLRPFLPACCFERVESIRIDAGVLHAHERSRVTRAARRN